MLPPASRSAESVELKHLAADILGWPTWAKRALAGRPRPFGEGGALVPAKISDISNRPDDTSAFFLERGELVERLRDRYRSSVEPPTLHERQEENLERLLHPESRVVVCGQQPGFLGGPLFNVYKAIQTARLARALEERWGTPVVPIFWVHSDDHDLAEVNHAHLLNRNLDLARVGLPAMGSGKRPIFDHSLDAGEHRLDALRAHLDQVLTLEGDRETWLDSFFPVEGESLGEAFVRGHSRLLGHLGLLYLEPCAIREPISRATAHVLSKFDSDRLRAALDRARAEQAPAEIAPEEVPWVFRLEGSSSSSVTRRAVRFEDGRFQLDGEPGSRSATELSAWMVQEPEGWSPGYLTRPLAQDLCLPNVAYVSGWGELKYLLPLTYLRADLELPSPALVPRVSVTLSSPAERASLDRLEVTAETFLARRGQIEVEEGDTHPAVELIKQEASRSASFTTHLKPTLESLDRSLSNQLRRTARDVAALYEKLAKKAERVDANRRGKSRRHLRRLENSWFGNGHPQERVLTALQYGVSFGDGWVQRLTEDLDPLSTEHLLVELSTAAKQAR